MASKMSKMTKQKAENMKLIHSRGKRFSNHELSIFVEQVKANKHILFGSFTSTITHELKQKTWQAIAEKINASSTVSRTSSKLKDKWSDLACRTKKKARKLDTEMKQTGNRPISDDKKLTNIEHTVLEILGKTAVHGLPEGLDTMEDSCDDEHPTSVLAPDSNDSIAPETNEQVMMDGHATGQMNLHEERDDLEGTSTLVDDVPRLSSSIPSPGSVNKTSRNTRGIATAQEQLISDGQEVIQLQRETLEVMKKRLEVEKEIAFHLGVIANVLSANPNQFPSMQEMSAGSQNPCGTPSYFDLG